MILPPPPADLPPALTRLVLPPPPPGLPSVGGYNPTLAGRDEIGRWKPGTATRGRPAVAAEIKKAARAEGINSINRLIDLRDYSPDDRIRLAAAQALLDRGYGKPVQQVEVAAAGVFEEMDAEELRAYVRSKTPLLIEGTLANGP